MEDVQTILTIERENRQLRNLLSSAPRKEEEWGLARLQREIIQLQDLFQQFKEEAYDMKLTQDEQLSVLSKKVAELEQNQTQVRLHLDQGQKLQGVVNDVTYIRSVLAEMKISMEVPQTTHNKADQGVGHVLSDVKDPQVQSFGMDRGPEEEQPVDSTCHESCSPLTWQLEHTYSLQESIWDAGLFIGLYSLGVQSSIYLGIAMMINVAVQLVFCVVCWLAFRQPQIREESEFLMKMWRFNAAHDVANVQAMWPFSLATQVCNGDESLFSSAEQKYYVDAISWYRPEGAALVGELMCLMCLVCFWNILWSDCKQTFRFAASLHFKRGRHTRLSLVDDEIIFQSVSRVRIVLCWTTVTLRLAVVASLGMIGTIWLAHTVSVVDLILNAAALELILSVDELIYAGRAPSLVKEHVLKCAPFTTWSFNRKIGADVEEIVGMLIFFALLPVVYFWKVQHTSTLLKKVGDALCGGTQNLVYGVDALGIVNVHDAMAEPPYIPFTSVDTATDQRTLALSEVLSGKSREEWQYARWAPSMAELKQKVSADLDITMSLTSQCIDVLTSANCQHFDACPQYRKALHALTGDTSFEWCSDLNVELHCYGNSALALMSKSVCPVTCGCTSLTGGIYVVGTGSEVHCPMTCHPLLEMSFANIKDVCNEDEDDTSRMWELWMDEAATFLPDYIRKPLRDQGCIALAMATDEHRAELCHGDHGIVKPLLGVCPRACGCIPNAHVDVCTWRGHTLEACSCHGWASSIEPNCQNDACKNHAAFQGWVGDYNFEVHSLEDVNKVCGCPSWLIATLLDFEEYHEYHVSSDACHHIFNECPEVPRLWNAVPEDVADFFKWCNSSDQPT